MKVMTWVQQRSRILSRLAGIDQAIASRAESIQKSWHSMHDAGHYLNDNTGEAPVLPQESRAVPKETSSVPEYLR
jgi:hypothetical protein